MNFVTFLVFSQLFQVPLCEFEFDSIRILDECEKDLKLRYMESIYLKFDKQSLNTQEWSIPLNVM